MISNSVLSVSKIFKLNAGSVNKPMFQNFRYFLTTLMFWGKNPYKIHKNLKGAPTFLTCCLKLQHGCSAGPQACLPCLVIFKYVYEPGEASAQPMALLT